MITLGFRVIVYLLCAVALGASIYLPLAGRRPDKCAPRRSQASVTAAPAPSPAPTSAPAAASRGKVAAIYYGWLIDKRGEPNEDARRLAAGHPDMVIVAGYTESPRRNNLPPPVRDLIHSAGARIAVYVATGYGKRPPGDVQAETADAVANGDAVFLDEVVSSFDDLAWAYYSALAGTVHAAGKTVIANVGVAAFDRRVMEIADIVMVEHQWGQLAKDCAGCGEYPPERFMGVSSNEPGAARELGHAVDAQQAAADTKKAWALGIGWHYSSDRYTEIPPWYETYIQLVRAGV